MIKKKELNDVLEVFKSRQGSWFSRFESYLSRLSEALSRNGRFFDEVRIMDVAIALEGMYELPKYTKKQALAERISRFLGASEEDRRNLEESVKRFYDARSEIVHGDSMGTSPFRNDATFVTGFTLARRSLFKLLIEGPPKDWTKWKVLDN